jgi:carboxylate-amine ligase
VGIEEELFLVDPGTRRSAPRAQEVLKLMAEHGPEAERGALDRELFRHQIETQTPPVGSMDELRDHVAQGRQLAARAADRASLATIASGTVPTASSEALVTSHDRYLDMRQTFGEIAQHGDTCGMHVHVGVESPEVGVSVIDHTAPWLPVILALSTNSPFHDGRDTSYASWRSQSWSQWPSAGPTERFGSVETYREVARRMRQSGAAKDDAMLYFDARLAANFPTVEFRTADVCTDPEDGVLIAALLRALVSTHVEELEHQQGPGLSWDAPVWRSELLRAATWRAARYGVSERLLDPTTGDLEDASVVLRRLLEVVGESLAAEGDLDLAEAGVARVLAGSGSSRQRAAFDRTGSLEGVVDDLVERTTLRR